MADIHALAVQLRFGILYKACLTGHPWTQDGDSATLFDQTTSFPNKALGESFGVRSKSNYNTPCRTTHPVVTS